jgi:hypothetical protein
MQKWRKERKSKKIRKVVAPIWIKTPVMKKKLWSKSLRVVTMNRILTVTMRKRMMEVIRIRAEFSSIIEIME